MALLKHRDRSPDAIIEWPLALFPSWARFDEFFADTDGRRMIKVEEFTEDGTLVIRAELPGIDPDKDVEITIEGEVLHIAAHRREEEEKTERAFHRKEFRYGSFTRSLALPEGADASTVSATYVDGVLEVRVPLPEEPPKESAYRVPITQS